LLGAVAEAALSKPRAMLGGAVALLVVFGFVAAGAPTRLGTAAPEAAGSESADAAAQTASALGREPEPGMLIVTRGRDPVDSGVYEVALETVTSQLKSDDDVAEVRRGPVSDDDRTTVLEVYFRDDDSAVQQQALERIESDLDAGLLDVSIAGEAAVLLDARRSLGSEVIGLELLILPLTVLVLALVVGLRLVIAPLLAAALAILGSATVLRLLGGPLDLSIVGLLPAAVVALALATEFSLLIARSHRDELERESDESAAIERAVRVAGRPVLAASIAGALIPLALLVVPVAAARSTAIGAASAALIAGMAALAVTPSLLVAAGPMVEEPDAETERPRGVVSRVTGFVGERRLVALLAVVATVVGLLAAAWPVVELETVALGAAGLPTDSDARRAEDQVAAELGVATSSRATASLPGADRTQVDQLRQELEGVEGVASAMRPEDSGDLAAVGVGLEAPRGSLLAREGIDAMRQTTAPVGAAVSGYDAAALDADEKLGERLPIGAAIAALLLAVVVFVLVRQQPLLAIGLGIASLLPAAAAAGLLTLVFDAGGLTDLFDYAPQGGPHLDALLAVLAAAAAVSAARSVAYPIVLRAEHAVAVRRRAAERAAGLLLAPAATATVIAAAASAVLVGSNVLPVKEAGIALAVALILDLVALRVLLVPALGRLLQRTRP